MLLAVLSPNSMYLIQKWEAGHLIHLEEEKLESTKGECVHHLSFFGCFSPVLIMIVNSQGNMSENGKWKKSLS